MIGFSVRWLFVHGHELDQSVVFVLYPDHSVPPSVFGSTISNVAVVRDGRETLKVHHERPVNHSESGFSFKSIRSCAKSGPAT